jgi:hypothetical protein
MIRIYDDIIPKNVQDQIVSIIETPSFPWYFVEDVTYQTKNRVESFLNVDKTYPGFLHQFFINNVVVNSDFDIIKNLISFVNDFDINSYDILNCRTFMQLPLNHNNSDYKHNHKHTDADSKINDVISFLYYVKDSDGDTLFFGKNIDDEINIRVKPKKGRVVLFDSHIYHSSVDPVNETKRIIINFILKKRT